MLLSQTIESFQKLRSMTSHRACGQPTAMVYLLGEREFRDRTTVAVERALKRKLYTFNNAKPIGLDEKLMFR